ncbi:MAG: TldD/PmbA family protein [Candidatus Korarchaeum sp.]|nr:TldD/PmbA family protein [Candidatus Korarchaeum sp.]MDW8035853.1 TldD/PmbA family protein [Candidatus Korarchaeum sp.]
MLVEDAVKAAVSEGADDAEAFEVRMRRILLNVEKGVLKTSSTVREVGLGVRACLGKRLGLAFATNPSGGSSVGKRAFMNVKASPEDADFHSLPEPRTVELMEGLLDPKIRDIDVEDASSLFMSSVEAAKLSPSIISVSGIFALTYEEVRIFSSTGVDVSESRTSFDAFLEATAKDGDKRGSGFNFSNGRKLSMLDLERLGREAGEIAIKSLDSTKIGVETLPIVLKPKALHNIIPFIVDEAANAENIQYGRSFLTNRLSSQVASDSISIVDDGRIPWLTGSSSFDDEGIPTRSTKVIEDGTFRSPIHNWYTAKREGKESTGNASREYRRVPSISANNVKIEALKSEMSEEELLDIRRGVLVLYTGDTPNLATGEFSGMAETAFLIEKGEPTKSLRQTGIAFTLEGLMRELDGVGRDIESVGSYLGGSIRVRARVSGPG